MNEQTNTLSPGDFGRLCKLIYEQSGIHLTEEKKVMLEGRLKRRMAHFDLASYRDYCEYLFGGQDQEEIIHLIDAVTTNKTDFFREKKHFDYLAASLLPEFMRQMASRRPLLIWSAGCSTGEEPYTLAMVLKEFASTHPGFRFRILATDISTAVLAKAERAVFSAEAIQPVAPELRRKYFLHSRDRENHLVRVVPELRRMIEFRRLNLMEEFGFSDLADAIFCRNVVIYFDRPTQEQLFRRLCQQLVEGGHLFVGHSESLHQMDVPLVPVAPALYRKQHGRRGH